MSNAELNLKNAESFFNKYINSKLGKNKLKIVEKESSKLMQLCGWFLAKLGINKVFMVQYITTIGTTIYFPKQLLESLSPRRFMEVIIHESLHVLDEHSHKFLYKPTYLPELFVGLPSVLLMILFFCLKLPVVGFMFLVLALASLLPVPKPGRYHWEIRAYSTSIVCSSLYGYTDGFNDLIKRWVTNQLAGSSYYFTWPFKGAIDKALSNKPETYPLYSEAKSFFENEFVDG
jgi:hypothetical protein